MFLLSIRNKEITINTKVKLFLYLFKRHNEGVWEMEV
jgi:hypothetical protein